MIFAKKSFAHTCLYASSLLGIVCFLTFIVYSAQQNHGPSDVFFITKNLIFWIILLILFYYLPRILKNNNLFKKFLEVPTLVIFTTAMIATGITASPIIFEHKSLVSPNNGGATLLYDHFPTLPNYSNQTTTNVPGTDTGTMMWQHIPWVMTQERAIKNFNEFPLWDRYHSSGTTMIGQGQVMLGDPINWFTWLIGTNSLIFDIKFLILRVLFATSLGMATFVLTKNLTSASMVSLLSTCISFFSFRINHPEIFGLCYYPLIIVAWLKLIYEPTHKNRFKWLLCLFIANWLVINSGVVKDAYVAMLLFNTFGLITFIFEKKRFNTLFYQWSILILVTGVAFLMITVPLWMSLLNEILHGKSAYEIPGVIQIPLWQIMGFGDSIYYLRANGYYFPAINICLFSGMILSFSILFTKIKFDRKAALYSLFTITLILIACIFNIVPSFFLLHIPFINNIQHINTSFSILLISPACILAGVGFNILEKKSKLLFIPPITLLIFFFSYVYNLGNKDSISSVISYFLIDLIAVCYLPTLLLNLIKGRLNFLLTGVCITLILLTLGNYKMFPNRFHSFAFKPVFNPQKRINLQTRPLVLQKIYSEVKKNPQRILGLDDTLISGFNAALELEAIDGPEAMRNFKYQTLINALKIPNTWGWRINLNEKNLDNYQSILDFLGVGFIVSPKPIFEKNITYLDNDQFLYAYSRNSVWPRAFYSQKIIPYNTLENVLQLIQKNNIYPFVAVNNNVIKEYPTLQSVQKNLTNQKNSLVKGFDYLLTNNKTKFTIQIDSAPGVIYLNEAGNPKDFVAKLNNKKVPCISTNYAFKGIIVEKPGVYQVSFEYWPKNFTIYLIVALLGFVLWLISLFIFWKKCLKHN